MLEWPENSSFKDNRPPASVTGILESSQASNGSQKVKIEQTVNGINPVQPQSEAEHEAQGTLIVFDKRNNFSTFLSVSGFYFLICKFPDIKFILRQTFTVH